MPSCDDASCYSPADSILLALSLPGTLLYLFLDVLAEYFSEIIADFIFEYFYLTFFGSLIYWFAIGSFIGWLVGYTKKQFASEQRRFKDTIKKISAVVTLSLIVTIAVILILLSTLQFYGIVPKRCDIIPDYRTEEEKERGVFINPAPGERCYVIGELEYWFKPWYI